MDSLWQTSQNSPRWLDSAWLHLAGKPDLRRSWCWGSDWAAVLIWWIVTHFISLVSKILEFPGTFSTDEHAELSNSPGCSSLTGRLEDIFLAQLPGQGIMSKCHFKVLSLRDWILGLLILPRSLLLNVPRRGLCLVATNRSGYPSAKRHEWCRLYESARASHSDSE